MIKTSQEAKDWVKAFINLDPDYNIFDDNEIYNMERSYDAGANAATFKLEKTGQPWGVINTGKCPWKDGETVYYHLRDGMGYSITPEAMDWSLDADNPIVLSFKGIRDE